MSKKATKRGEEVDDWTTVRLQDPKKTSVVRMMRRRGRMRDYLVTGAIWYSGSDKA